jgi:hypothetical protein
VFAFDHEAHVTDESCHRRAVEQDKREAECEGDSRLPRRRLAAAVAIAAVVGAGILPAVAGGGRARSVCGTERWAVKTLQDRPTLLPLQVTTLRFLVTRPAPPVLPYRRLSFERHVYRVIAAVTEIRAEEDGDLHVILRNGRLHMIAEAPSPGCFARAKLVRKVQMLVARRAVRVCRRAEVTGVAFFDYFHGQIGVAPNAIELHPILKFLWLGG